MPTVVTRIPGRRAGLLPNWNLKLPPEATEDGEPLTLRALLSRIVREEVASFRERQRKQRYVTVLSEDEVRGAVAKGKVSMGGCDTKLQEVDEEDCIGAALQAFEDGMYLVLIDDVEQKHLDQQVYVAEETTITFIRLTFLAGG